jgi:hypothetical protein
VRSKLVDLRPPEQLAEVEGGEDAMPLFVVTESGALLVCTADKKPSPKPGQALISLVDPRLAAMEPERMAEAASAGERGDSEPA